jgi:hypothetical protein
MVLLFLSWAVGALIEPLFRRRLDYITWRSSLFRSPTFYRMLGLHFAGRVIGRLKVNFNENLRGLKNQRAETLVAVRCAMTAAEIGHWIGFVAMGFMTAAIWMAEPSLPFLISNLILNFMGNAYLSLLQQYNKWRIDRLVSRKRPC